MPNEPIDMDAARAGEMGSILRSLYVALGGAAVLHDEALMAELTPIIMRYRARTRAALEGTPFDP